MPEKRDEPNINKSRYRAALQSSPRTVLSDPRPPPTVLPTSMPSRQGAYLILCQADREGLRRRCSTRWGCGGVTPVQAFGGRAPWASTVIGRARRGPSEHPRLSASLSAWHTYGWSAGGCPTGVVLSSHAPISVVGTVVVESVPSLGRSRLRSQSHTVWTLGWWLHLSHRAAVRQVP